MTEMERFSILSVMSEKAKSFSEIVETWDRFELAYDLRVPPERVRGWLRDNSIPSSYWKDILSMAPDRGIDITPDLLIDLAARH